MEWEKVYDKSDSHTHSEIKSTEERKEEYKNNTDIIKETKLRKWLCKTGKANVLEFSDNELRKLKECFLALDDDGSEAIGIDELEEPLIGLGFADTRDDVLDMINDVDDDGSGQIEFAEFLLIIKGDNSSKDEKSEKINQFFKDMSQGKIGSHNRKKS